MALVDEIRERRGDPDDPFDQEAAKREFGRDRKRRARSEGDSARRIYREGVREGKGRAERNAKPASKRPASSRRRRAAPVRQGARQLVTPIRRQVASGTYTLGLVLAVVALYWLLENAGAVSGLLGGIGKALDWVASPERTIPNTGTIAKPPGTDAQHPIITTG